jgi:hypothetical protein
LLGGANPRAAAGINALPSASIDAFVATFSNYFAAAGATRAVSVSVSE